MPALLELPCTDPAPPVAQEGPGGLYLVGVPYSPPGGRQGLSRDLLPIGCQRAHRLIAMAPMKAMPQKEPTITPISAGQPPTQAEPISKPNVTRPPRNATACLLTQARRSGWPRRPSRGAER